MGGEGKEGDMNDLSLRGFRFSSKSQFQLRKYILPEVIALGHLF